MAKRFTNGLGAPSPYVIRVAYIDKHPSTQPYSAPFGRRMNKVFCHPPPGRWTPVWGVRRLPDQAPDFVLWDRAVADNRPTLAKAHNLGKGGILARNDCQEQTAALMYPCQRRGKHWQGWLARVPWARVPWEKPKVPNFRAEAINVKTTPPPACHRPRFQAWRPVRR